MKHKGTVELQTQRLLLRRFTPSDGEDMFETWAGDDRVTKYMSWPTHKNVDVSRTVLELWEASYLKDEFYNWGIVFEGRLIGSIGAINVDEANQNAEAGYCIGYPYWGRGIVSEALAGVLRFLLVEVGMHRISARHDVDNPASGRVMQKCGMKREGVSRGSLRRGDGCFVDTVLYGILREDLPPGESESCGDSHGA